MIGDITDSDLNVIFDSSEGTFKKDIYLEEGTNYYDIILGYSNGAVHFTNDYNPSNQTAPIESLTAAKISSWDAANDKHITNMEFQEGGTGNEGKFELYLTAEDANQNRTTDWLIEEGANITMSITERVNGSGQGAINISADTSSPNGLATKSYVTSALNNVVTGIALDNGSGVVDTATNGDFTFIPGSGISILRDGTNTNDLTFAFDNSSLGFINQTNGDARYIQIGGETQTLDDVITNGATTTTTAVIPFYYANQAAFPSASTYHGAIAHSHNDGAMYFAHSGVWNKMANSSDLNNYALASALPTAQEEQNWNNAYNNSITDITLNTVTGDADEGKIVLTQEDLGTLKTTSLDLRYAKLGTHPAVSTSATNTSNTGNTVIQNLTFDSVCPVLSVTSGTVSTLELASGVKPTNGHVATFDANGDILSSSITSILPTTTVFTSGSPDFGSNTITAGNFILSSDRDLKENIIPLAEREIKVDFKEYNFKGSNRTRFGVIAQELEEHHPEFVHTRESGDKSVAYIDLLVAKVHELENRIKELENASTRNG